jgi:hypothetical protein
MKVAKITFYSVPLDTGINLTRYVKGKSSVLEKLIVRMETDEGLVGRGESCSAP